MTREALIAKYCPETATNAEREGALIARLLAAEVEILALQAACRGTTISCVCGGDDGARLEFMISALNELGLFYKLVEGFHPTRETTARSAESAYWRIVIDEIRKP